MPGIFDAPLASHGRQRLGLGGALRTVRHDGARVAIDAPDEVGISVCLSETFAVACRVGGRTERATPRVGSFTLLAPGCPAQIAITGDCRALQLRLPLTQLRAILAEDHGADGGAVEFVPRVNCFDPEVLRLAGAAAAGGPAGLALAVRQIAAHLWRRHSTHPGRGAAGRAWRGGIAPARLRRVTAFVDAHLDGPLPLAALAREAALSPYHFAREFKHTTGRTPHAYVLERRVARAMTLLARRGVGVREAAHAAGFADASHLGRHLRRRLGVSAAEFRALSLA